MLLAWSLGVKVASTPQSRIAILNHSLSGFITMKYVIGRKSAGPLVVEKKGNITVNTAHHREYHF
jgi:hypothetical protein